MKNRIVRIAMCVTGVCLLAACAELKDTGRTIGHTTKDVTTAIGHGTRDVVKSIGENTKKIVSEN